ncbi:MAG: hypothetical protein PWP23_3046 [Candidatus Sumerlaeota bacterium]|nr:hypothetical protein [Candidatus Sumerlaeota bacterium]
MSTKSSDKARRRRNRWRAFKFAVIRRVLVPVAMPLLKLWMRTWRLSFEPPEFFDMLADTAERPVVSAVLHENIVVDMGSLVRCPKGCPFKLATLVSPSRDGQLQGDLVRSFGHRPVDGSSSKKGASGLLALHRALSEGYNAAIAVDGPNGPRGIPKPGIFALAASERARLHLVLAASSPQWRLPTWDRFLVPPPFARVRLRLVPFHDYADGKRWDGEADALRALIVEQLRDLGQRVDGIPGVEEG